MSVSVVSPRVLGNLRSRRAGKLALWSRATGLALLALVFFLPMSAVAVVAIAVPALALFLFGSLVWLLRTEEPWLRPRS